MARTKLMTMALSTALLMAGAIFHTALNFVEHSPTMLYLAGQFKMATGDTNAALDLIGRAASVGTSPQATPARTAPTKAEASAPAPIVCAKRPLAPRPSHKVSAMARAASVASRSVRVNLPRPEVLMAGFSPDRFRIPSEHVRAWAEQQAMQQRLIEQQNALKELEHFRMDAYVTVMQSAPHPRLPHSQEFAPAMP